MKRFPLLCALLLSLSSTPAPAVDYIWVGDETFKTWGFLSFNGSGFDTNWSPENNLLPGPVDTATFDSTGLVDTVTLSAGRQINSITFDSDFGYTLTGALLQIVSGDLDSLGGGGAADHTIDSDVDLGAAGEWRIIDDLTVNGTISGSHLLTKTSLGTLTLTANNDHDGIRVEAGTLEINGAGRIGADGTDLTLVDGSVLLAADTINAGSGRELILENGGMIDTNGNEVTWTGEVSGTGLLTKFGPNSLVLSGSNTYSGGTALYGGSIDLDSNTAAGTGDITIHGGSLSYGDTVSVSNAIDLQNNLTVSVAAATAVQSGAIGETGGSYALTKNGAGAFGLSAANSYTGGTILNAGKLVMNNNSAVGTGGITVNDGSLGYGSVNISNTISLQANTILEVNSGNATQSGVISESGGSYAVTKTGAGTLTLSGVNTYSGGTNLNDGILRVNSDSNLGAAGGPLTFDGGDLLWYASFDLDPNRAITLDAGGGTLRTDTFNTTVSQVIVGSGSLTKNGAGTLTLGGVNTYSGGTILNGGTLLLTEETALGRGELTINAGATVDLDANTRRVQGNTLIDNGELSLDGTTLNAGGRGSGGGKTDGFDLTLSGSSAVLDVTGTASISLNGLGFSGGFPATSAGDFTMSGGTFNLGADATLVARGGSGSSATAPGNVGSATISGGVATIDGIVDLRGRNNQDGGGRPGGDVTVSGSASVSLTGTFNLKGGNGDLSFGNASGGRAGDVLISGGDFILNDPNATVDFRPGTGDGGPDGQIGSFEVSGGTLELNSGLILGSIGTASADPLTLLDAGINLTGSGVANVNNNMTVDGGTISRDSSADFNLGSGLTLTATNGAQLDFSGDVLIDDGTTIDLQSGADLIVSSFLDVGSDVFGGSGNGTLIVDGAGSTVIANSNVQSHVWGSGGFTADVTFRNDASGFLGWTSIAGGATVGTMGILHVESRAMVTTGRLDLAAAGAAGMIGEIHVRSAGSSLTQVGNVQLNIGSDTAGSATINVTDEGMFSTGTGAIAVEATGTVNIDTGGLFFANGDMTIDGAVNLIDGVLTASMITLNGAGALNFSDGLLRVDDFNGTLVQDGGTLVIGSPAGTTDVSDQYQLNNGTLVMELFGGGLSPVPGVDFDQITADTATLAAGTLLLGFGPGYTPTVGDSFQIVSTANGVTGVFDEVPGTYLGGGLGLDVQYNANDVTVEVISVLLGDFDVDGDVDGFDFLLWQRNPSIGPLSDWESNYGMSLSVAAAVVPEPSTVLLLATSLTVLTLARQRS